MTREQLQARILIKAARRQKRAAIGSDYMLALPSTAALNAAIPAGGTIANVIGGGVGLVQSAPDLATLSRLDQNRVAALIPGEGARRIMARRKAIRKLLKDKSRRYNVRLSEVGTPLEWIGSPVGALAAALMPRRTLLQQQQYENSGAATAANLFLPGAATYNYFKSLGATRHLIGKDEEQVLEQLEKEKKEEEEKKRDKERKTEETEKKSGVLECMWQKRAGFLDGVVANTVKDTANKYVLNPYGMGAIGTGIGALSLLGKKKRTLGDYLIAMGIGGTMGAGAGYLFQHPELFASRTPGEEVVGETDLPVRTDSEEVGPVNG